MTQPTLRTIAPANSCTSRKSQNGYVLVMTIAALALLSLAGAFIGQQISTAVRLAAAEQTFAEQERHAQDVMAKMIYLLTTVKNVPAGIGGESATIRLDGRWYDAGDQIAVSLQDARGLVSLKTAQRTTLESLLISYGIPIERGSALVDALLDYADTDSQRRLQGAEAEEYQSAALPPPRNQLLASTRELLRIYGWKSETALWGDDNILQQTVLSDDTGINPATATWRTLVSSLGISSREAQAFVEARAELDSTGVSQLAKPYIGQLNGEDLLKLHTPILYPSPTTVITTMPKGGQRGWRATLTITPDQHHTAWRLVDIQEVQLAQPIATTNLPPLPDVSPYAVNIERERAALPM